MRVISKKRLKEFWGIHPQAEAPLKRWYKEALFGRWASLQEVRKTFPNADGVALKSKNTITVFNVGKTGYRILSEINYPFGRVYIRLVLTHDEYVKGGWKKQL